MPKRPYNVAKKQQREDKLKKKNQEQRLQDKKDRQKRKVELRKKMHAYKRKWNSEEARLRMLRIQAKQSDSYFVEPEPKVALVVRIRGINRLSPKVRKILRLLRLRQIHNAVLIKINKATLGMLKFVEPWIAYGYPSLDTVKKLVGKRGYLKVDRQRIPLVNNEQVAEQFGHLGLTGVACLIDQLYTCGDNFTAVSSGLWPFKLSSPRGGYRGKKRIHFVEGGTYGDHEKLIDKFVQKML